MVEGRYSLHCLFYAEDGLVASTNPVWLQGTFDTLMRLFDRVGFSTNVGNTARMLCHPFRIVGTQSEVDYERRMTGEVLTYWARQRI